MKQIVHEQTRVVADSYTGELIEETTQKTFTVKKEGGVFVVEGEWLFKILETIHFDDYESMNFFQRVLQSNGIIEKLEEMGVQEGDPVRIGELEFDYIR